jgi:hypothetical protein
MMKDKLDLPDSENDKLHLQPEETIIELPDVEDIPGQEHIKVPFFNEFVDTTISSDGEEGVGIFNQEKIKSNVSETERLLLQKSATQTPGDEEEKDVTIISLDKTDNEGAPLNEGNLLTDRFGEDLDLPEAEEVDEEE